VQPFRDSAFPLPDTDPPLPEFAEVFAKLRAVRHAYVRVFENCGAVSKFRFHPRDPHMPFTEDDCVSGFGYWCDEDWADGLMVRDSAPDPNWLTTIQFMSGTIILIQSDSAHATIAD
jgi:hypothetical protein